MKLYYDKNSKDPVYYAQQGFRHGKKTTTRNVARIGKHSELLKTTADPLAYAKEEISRMNEEYSKNMISAEFSIDFSEKLKFSEAAVSSSTLLNIGYFFLHKIYGELRIADFFKKVSADLKITFDPDLANRFMTFSRILAPASKLHSSMRLERFYERPDLEYVHILRSMDILAEHGNEYIAHLFKHSGRIVPRDTTVCYFDCSNFYFETETQDENIVDEVTGEEIRGLRRFGISKEHRPNPIVQMGLFMDGRGIPLSMSVNPGSDNEQKCAVPLEKELVRMFGGSSFVYCADAGLNSFDIRSFNSMGGRRFVVTQSLKKLSARQQAEIFSDRGYHLLSSKEPVSLEEMKTFDKNLPANHSLYKDKAYKIVVADRDIDTGLRETKSSASGKTSKTKVTGLLRQDLIVTFSRKMMEYQRAVRQRQIERAQKILNFLDPKTWKKGQNDVTRFIKRVSGKGAAETFELDREMIAKEEKYDGFYAVATNLEASPETVLDISARRYKIEECFRLMKSELRARPVYHRNSKRIVAHFLICYTALLVYKLLEAKLDDSGTHFSPEDVIETLRNMEVCNMDDICYRSVYNASQICTALNSTFGLELDKKFYKPKELNKKIKKISK